MEEIILSFYSNGDLVMMFSKFLAYLLMFFVFSLVIGVLRGMKF